MPELIFTWPWPGWMTIAFCFLAGVLWKALLDANADVRDRIWNRGEPARRASLAGLSIAGFIGAGLLVRPTLMEDQVSVSIVVLYGSVLGAVVPLLLWDAEAASKGPLRRWLESIGGTAAMAWVPYVALRPAMGNSDLWLDWVSAFTVFGAAGGVLWGLLRWSPLGLRKEIGVSVAGVISVQVFTALVVSRYPHQMEVGIALGPVRWGPGVVADLVLVAVILGLGVGAVFLAAIILARWLGAAIGPLVNRIVSRRHFEPVTCATCLKRSLPETTVFFGSHRGCEHCGKTLEGDNARRALVFTFGRIRGGDVSEKRILNNPDFGEKAWGKVDVQEILIDVPTTKPLLLERMLIHLVNHPPYGNLDAVKVRYRGSLESLGSNLEHLLREHFPKLRALG
ncbi:MAG: hypothetical protein ABIK09_05880 [Pseudomonadota bacterium]